jgi:hypothetical protein
MRHSWKSVNMRIESVPAVYVICNCEQRTVNTITSSVLTARHEDVTATGGTAPLLTF